MRSRQFSFGAFPDEMESIERAILHLPDCEILSYISKSRKPVSGGAWTCAPGNLEWSKGWIVQKSRVREIKLHYVKEQKHWLIDEYENPVIELCRPYPTPRRPYIPGGRVYYHTSVCDDGGWVKRDQKFLDWAEVVFREVKKMFEYDKERQLYLTAKCKKWINGGKKPR